MGYYDGNTVTALWNYAQRYALNDNSYDTNFGPSTPGAINLISGQTNNVTDQVNAGGDVVEDGQGGYHPVSDADPIGDMCSDDHRRNRPVHRSKYRRSAQLPGHHLGLLSGRLQPFRDQP